VRDRENSSVEINCTLANVKVTVEYSDAFKKYFADYSTTIHSTGGEYIEFSKTETRAATKNPGNHDSNPLEKTKWDRIYFRTGSHIQRSRSSALQKSNSTSATTTPVKLKLKHQFRRDNRNTTYTK